MIQVDLTKLFDGMEVTLKTCLKSNSHPIKEHTHLKANICNVLYMFQYTQQPQKNRRHAKGFAS